MKRKRVVFGAAGLLFTVTGLGFANAELYVYPSKGRSDWG